MNTHSPLAAFALSLTICWLLSIPQSFAQQPRLMVQTGNNGIVSCSTLSRDGKLVASGDLSGQILLWDARSGRQLLSIVTGDKKVMGLAFSPDAKTLASCGDGPRVRLWNVADGTAQRVLTIPMAREDVHRVAFSPDGKLIAPGLNENALLLWDAATGEVAHTPKGENKELQAIAFSPDGRTLATTNNAKQLKLWDINTGSLLHTMAPGTEDNTTEFLALAFSPDGKLLASHGWNEEAVMLWNVSTGQLARKIATEQGAVAELSFSPNGKLLAVGSKHTILLLDPNTGRAVRNFGEDKSFITRTVFGEGGSTLFTETTDGVIGLWDVAGGKMTQSFRQRSGGVASAALARNDKILMLDGNNESLMQWDLSSNSEPVNVPRGEPDKSSAKPIALSPDNKLFASMGEEDTIRIWDSATRKVRCNLNAKFGTSFYAVAFSPDNKLLATSSMNVLDSELNLWNVATCSRVNTYHQGDILVQTIVFSPDGKLIASAQKDGLVVRNVATGATVKTLIPRADVSYRGAAFSVDGKLIAGGGQDKDAGLIHLFDAATGELRHTLKGFTHPVNRVAFSHDGKIVAGSSDFNFQQDKDFAINLFDTATGAALRTLSGHTDVVNSISFSKDDKLLISASEDGKTKIWDATSGALLLDLILIDDRDWLAATPDGLFDGSPTAWNTVLWRFSSRLDDYAPVETFFNEFYYPGLLQDIFAGQRPRAAQSIAQKDRRQPQLGLTMNANSGTGANALSAPNASVQIKINNAPAGAQDVRLFRNGSLVKVWHGDVLQGKTDAILSANISIVAGENHLTAYAFNHDNVKSTDATLNITGADSLKRKGVAYVLAVGVNTYANKDFDLKYAVADAQDFSQEWQAQQARLQTFASTEIIPLKDADASKGNIMKSLAELKAKVKPEDALVIYFAGHGTAQQNRFYLIPHDLGYAGGRDTIDEAGLKTILAHSISDLELQDALEGVDAGQLLMVIDACNSGQALESEEKRRGPMNSKGLAQLAYEKGMYILTAAQSYQAAQEASKFGHGFLTFALVEEGIKQTKADDEPKDGKVIVREWFDYATQRVPQMQVELMKETNGRGVKVAFVKGEEQIADPAERNVQRPRVFYRRELEAQPLVVAKP